MSSALGDFDPALLAGLDQILAVDGTSSTADVVSKASRMVFPKPATGAELRLDESLKPPPAPPKIFTFDQWKRTREQKPSSPRKKQKLFDSAPVPAPKIPRNQAHSSMLMALCNTSSMELAPVNQNASCSFSLTVDSNEDEADALKRAVRAERELERLRRENAVLRAGWRVRDDEIQ